MTIWYVLKLPEFISQQGLKDAVLLYPLSFIQPLGTLWFIYMLAVFFVAVKLLRHAPVMVVWLAAVILHAMHIETGARIVDEFAARFVFFYSGYAFAAYAFSVADFIGKQKTAAALTGLVIWAVLNAWAVFGGWSQMPVIELAMGYAGTAAVIAVGVLLARFKFGNLSVIVGQNSILIFLSYFIFMGRHPASNLLKPALFTALGLWGYCHCWRFCWPLLPFDGQKSQWLMGRRHRRYC